MKRFPSLKKNYEYQKVYQTGKSIANKYLVMYVLQSDQSNVRLGISTSKKVGNSVVRHQLARLIRESFRLSKDTLNDGLDIVIVTRASAKNTDFKTIDSAFRHLCGLHHILKESK